MPRVLIGRYELGPVIGAGAMAKVHMATDRTLGRKVAVKVLDDAAARSADPAARDRFLNEARSAARFTHHNAVSTFDAGEDAGVLFIVMEYVDGGTLADRLADDTTLPIHEAVAIATQVLEALAAMHASGILHRDVKPANVLLSPGGGVKLTDFGIAKRLDDIDDALTSSGTVVGTPRYLAPEQAVGGELGPATDVYLTGIVLHEMLTGERPRSALLGVPAQPPDPRRLRPEVPPRLAAAVSRALDYLPERRHPTARAMIDAIRLGGTDRPGAGSLADAGRAEDVEVDTPTTESAAIGESAIDDRPEDAIATAETPVGPSAGGVGADETMPTTEMSTVDRDEDGREREPDTERVRQVALDGDREPDDGGDDAGDDGDDAGREPGDDHRQDHHDDHRQDHHDDHRQDHHDEFGDGGPTTEVRQVRGRTRDMPLVHDAGADRVTRTADLPVVRGSSWVRWLPIAAAVLVLGAVGAAVALDRFGGDERGDPAELATLSSDEFLTQLRSSPGRFGPRGDDVRDQLDALLAETDPERFAELRADLQIAIFVWVTDDELDPSVGDQVARLLDG